MKQILIFLASAFLLASCSQETVPPESSRAHDDTHVKTNPRQKRNQHIHHIHQK